MPVLENIHRPEDVKALPARDLPVLAREIREALIETTSLNGGHVGPNLGVVELTIALHRVFESPKDRFVFDVSHQGYVHKLLTGRGDAPFYKIRKSGGYSGFLCRSESDYDCYGAGHAGTALSAALGMATARDINGGDEHVVAICGDAAFTCGITMEALNNVVDSTKRLIVILNDNEWSIDKNTGAIAEYFNELITNTTYQRLHDDLESFLHRVPGGDSLLRFGQKAKEETKDFVLNSSLFEKYGLRYIGPIDGHDLDQLHKYLQFCKASTRPVFLHIITEKGRGLPSARAKPEKFHGTSPYDPETGKSRGPAGKPIPKYQDVFGETVVNFARKDSKVVGITAAMPSGTGLSLLRDSLPGQYFDVGIAEEHAVLFAAGLATRDVKPVVAIYSTFLQRAYDCIIHDVALQNLDVLFCMDRAGLSPNDGPTHHGLFDISYLRCVPNVVVMQPKDEIELQRMIATGLNFRGPVFIRYPRGAGRGEQPLVESPEPLEIGKAEVIKTGKEISIWALGSMVYEAVQLADEIENETGVETAVVNGRFAKPLDADLLRHHAGRAHLVVTMEDHVVSGGFGSAVLESLEDAGSDIPVLRIGWPDAFVAHGSGVDDLRRQNGLAPEMIKERILQRYFQAAPKAESAPQEVRHGV